MLYNTPKNPHHTIAKTKIKADVIKDLQKQGFEFSAMPSYLSPFPCEKCHLHSLIKDYLGNMYYDLEMDCTKVGCIQDADSFIIMTSHPKDMGIMPARNAIVATYTVYQVHG